MCPQTTGYTLLYKGKIVLSVKIGNGIDNSFRNRCINIAVRALCLYGLNKRNQFVSYAFAVELIEITLVVGRIFVTNFKVIGLPPWGRNIDITVCSGDNQFAFRLHSLPYFQRCHGGGIYKRYACKGIEMAFMAVEQRYNVVPVTAWSKQILFHASCTLERLVHVASTDTILPIIPVLASSTSR